MDTGMLITVTTLILGLLGAVVAVFKYFSAQDERLREKIAEAEQRTLLMIEKMQDGATKTLTAMQNALQLADTEIRRDMNALNDRLTQLSLDAVRKTDLSALEGRLTTLVGREVNTLLDALREMKIERHANTQRLEGKIDALMANGTRYERRGSMVLTPDGT